MDIKKSWIAAKPIAHRGFHNQEFPENSLPAFQNAIDNNFAIELDIRLIDDGTIVVFHDESLTRMTNSDGYISNLKKENLSEYRLNNTEFTIPTLEKTLEAINGKMPVLIELKNTNSPGALESGLVDLLSGYNGEVAVQSFNPYSLEYFKKNAPQYLRGQLSCVYKKENMRSLYKRYLLNRLKFNNVSKPDFIAFDALGLPNRYVEKTGLPVIAWTVRSNAELEAVLPHCINIIFEKFTPVITSENE